MATRPAAVDDLVSDRSVLNALAPFIDNDPSRSAQGGQGTIHYCRICGEALGEYISVDASLEVELTLETAKVSLDTKNFHHNTTRSVLLSTPTGSSGTPFF